MEYEYCGDDYFQICQIQSRRLCVLSVDMLGPGNPGLVRMKIQNMLEMFFTHLLIRKDR
jgi:hypothetical protein